MWRERYTKTRALACGAVVAIAVTVGCTPDGPGDGIPTHPGDTYSVTLEWDAPTTDAVGRPLEDLSGYRLYYRETESASGSETVIELAAESAWRLFTKAITGSEARDVAHVTGREQWAEPFFTTLAIMA